MHVFGIYGGWKCISQDGMCDDIANLRLSPNGKRLTNFKLDIKTYGVENIRDKYIRE